MFLKAKPNKRKRRRTNKNEGIEENAQGQTPFVLAPLVGYFFFLFPSIPPPAKCTTTQAPAHLRAKATDSIKKKKKTCKPSTVQRLFFNNNALLPQHPCRPRPPPFLMHTVELGCDLAYALEPST